MNKKNILILSDTIPGHYNQSFGILHLIYKPNDYTLDVHDLKLRFPFLRSIIRFLSRRSAKALTPSNAKKILSYYLPMKLDGVDLLIASGGNTAPVSAAIKFLYGIDVIQMGSPRGLDSDLFNALVTSEQYYSKDSNIEAAITPNKYSPELCDMGFINDDLEPLFCIGGKGIGYQYSLTEWNKFIENIKTISHTNNQKCILVTSRRTDPKIESMLIQALTNCLSSKSAWFHMGAHGLELSSLFGSASHIFVTEDSAMMISEAISSGRPVTTLYPSNINTPRRYSHHIEKYQSLGLINRMSIEQFDISARPNSRDLVDSFRKELKQKITDRIS